MQEILNQISQFESQNIHPTEILDAFVRDKAKEYPDLVEQVHGFRKQGNFDTDILTGLKTKLAGSQAP